jgi:DNA-binding FadR family transcriptional regulator
LEPFIVEWLAINGMPKAKWKELHDSWQCTMLDTLQVMTDFAEKDEAFHEQLAVCTENQTLLHYLHNVNERLHFIRLTNITETARLCETCEQHLQILDCIKKGVARSAREVMKTNIEGAHRKVEQAFKEGLSRAFQNHRAREEDGICMIS